jgi:DNA-binding GntR family transcriptional regulator
MGIARGTELEKAGRLEVGSTQLLTDLDHPVVRYADTITARMPDAIELEFFRTTGIVPVIVVSRTAYGQEGPLRLTRYIYPADEVRLEHHKATR